jgi:acetoin:2,6-dichlorophenolindophenol oxidoreductase subunit beta
VNEAVTMTDQINTVTAINWALDDALARDPRVIVFGEDVADPEEGGVFKVTAGLSSKYGERVRSTPISEMAFVGAGVGAAITGLRPVVEIMLMNFTAVCMDQITNHAAKLRFMSGGQTHVPMVMRMVTGSGFQTAGQHCDFLEAWFCHVAGLKVAMPSNPMDAYGLLTSAINDDDPVLFVEHLGSYWTPGIAPQRGLAIPLGKANVVRQGSDVTLIGYSRSAIDNIVVAAALEKKGISCEVIDLRTVQPLDMDTVLTSVSKTRAAVIVHEACRSFGVGAEVASRIHEALHGQLKNPVQRLGSKDAPVPFAKNLETAYVYSHADVEAAVRRAIA